jgi:DNA-binding NarL/FixJ family response regulator
MGKLALVKKILIIEDEPRMRRNLATILKLEGFTILEAGDGQSGVEMARTQLPDLILCDISMPWMDGYQVLHELRQNEATVRLPFLFLTARGEKTDIRTGMNLGADDYLTKPVTKTDLLAAIEARFRRATEQSPEARGPLASPEVLQSLGLTPREAEILFWVAQGKSNPDICSILDMQLFTVKKHLENIFQKLGVENRIAATMKALEVLGLPR